MNTSAKKIKKRILFLSLLLILVAFSGCQKNNEETTEPSESQISTTAPAQTTELKDPIIGTVLSEELNVREGIGINYEIVATLFEGTEVKILETQELNGVHWGRIELGWICLTYVNMDGEQMQDVEVTEPTESHTLSEPISGIVIAKQMNVRSGPGTNHTVVKSLKKNDSVIITEIDGIWGKTEEGWVNTIFVYFPDSIDSETVGATVTATKLNVRTGPSTEYESLYKLYADDKVEILKQVTSHGARWGYIGDGWICLEYVEFN